MQSALVFLEQRVFFEVCKFIIQFIYVFVADKIVVPEPAAKTIWNMH